MQVNMKTLIKHPIIVLLTISLFYSELCYYGLVRAI